MRLGLFFTDSGYGHVSCDRPKVGWTRVVISRGQKLTTTMLNQGNFVSIWRGGGGCGMIRCFSPPLREVRAVTRAPVIGLMFTIISNTRQLFIFSFLYYTLILTTSCRPSVRTEDSSSHITSLHSPRAQQNPTPLPFSYSIAA